MEGKRESTLRIGIIRHFKVACKPVEYMDAKGFREYNEQYDQADVIQNKVQIDQSEWKVCYCSDMRRAIETAKSVYDGKIITSKLLREVPMSPINEKSTRKTSAWWSVRARIVWLIVSHAFFMITFIKVLKEKGFKGKVPLHLKNGTLYILEK